jgi:hypothetical protein
MSKLIHQFDRRHHHYSRRDFLAISMEVAD